MAKYQTVRAADLGVRKRSFVDLCHLHGTGQSYDIYGTGYGKRTVYCAGVQTDAAQ